jgi:starvation-inducible outer membrane lipoprotein
MKRRFALLFLLTILVMVAACSTAPSNQHKTSSPSACSTAAHSAPAAKKKESQNPVDAEQVSIKLPAGWTLQKGDESFG